jgi:hypothetical protein
MIVSLPVTNTLVVADALDGSGSAPELTLDLNYLQARASSEVEALDRQNGEAVAAWEAMGRSEPPTREQTAELRKLARNTEKGGSVGRQRRQAAFQI